MGVRLRLYRVLWVAGSILLLNWFARFFPAGTRHRIYGLNARRLFYTILALRGLFIKVGQFLSLRVDLLPKPYTELLSKLQDEVPPVSYDAIKKRFVEDFGKPPEAVFASFNPQPIASASLAQVHRATLQSGEQAAVKILYPGIEKLVRIDLNILRITLKFLHRFRKHFDFLSILNEFEKFVAMEIDMLKEGKNAETLAKHFSSPSPLLSQGQAPDPLPVCVQPARASASGRTGRPQGERETQMKVDIPRVFWEYTRKGVLTTGFLTGIKVTRKEEYTPAGISAADVAEQTVSCYMKQIFSFGFFQADPHPGNIFVIPEKNGAFRIGLVDFGLCKQLPSSFLSGLSRSALAIINRDAKSLSSGMVELGFSGINGQPESLETFCSFVVVHVEDFLYKNPKELDIPNIIQEILEIAREKPLVKIPGDFVLIGRVFGLLTGLGKQLGVKVNVRDVILKNLAVNQ